MRLLAEEQQCDALCVLHPACCAQCMGRCRCAGACCVSRCCGTGGPLFASAGVDEVALASRRCRQLLRCCWAGDRRVGGCCWLRGRWQLAGAGCAVVALRRIWRCEADVERYESPFLCPVSAPLVVLSRRPQLREAPPGHQAAPWPLLALLRWGCAAAGSLAPRCFQPLRFQLAGFWLLPGFGIILV